VKITADTNVLLRAVVGDDEVQQQMAIETLEGAELVAIVPTPSASSRGCWIEAIRLRAATSPQ
jgi:predicted nucleic acid-binding protein